MDRICRGQPLSNRIKVGGAKTTALPLLHSSSGRTYLPWRPPRPCRVLEQDGIAVEPVTNDGCKLCLAGSISNTEAADELVRRMSATFLVPGYLLAWMSESLVSVARWLNRRVR